MSPTGPSDEPARLVVIGNFDGVHLGHRAVLATAQTQAKRSGLRLCVLTFDPHPAAVLSGRARPALTPTSRKKRLLEQLFSGLEVYVQHFDQALAALSPREFVKEILVDRLHAKTVLVGENFRFGQGRAGDLSTLKELGQEFGFEAGSEPLHGDASGTYSSTRVRGLLASGDVASAAEILGRAHRLTGKVERGDQRGRTLGFPTANLGEIEQAVPADGVYAVRVFRELQEGESFLGFGVANLGSRPTVSRPATVEVHILDFEGDLYEQRLGVELCERLRDVVKFDDIEALQAQIRLDAAQAQRLFGRAVATSPTEVQ